MPALLDLTRDGAVARVFLDRPDVRNAFNDALVAELTQAFASFAADPALRAVVLGGKGPAFCAGADLAWMREMGQRSWEQNHADAERLAGMLWAVQSCPVPVIGRVHGDCYAGGVGLAAACDVLVAVDSAHFCLSEAKLGLVPATIAPYVVRAMGERAARRCFATAERFDAATALRLGLVHELATIETLDAKVNEIVGSVLTNGPQAVRACKQLVQDVAGRPITPELRADTARRIADVRASDEAREGVQAFLQKRPPSWRA